MADADRDLLEQKLGIAVISTYQADEALRLAFQFLSMPPTPLRDDRPFAALVTLQVWWNEFF